MKVLLAFLLFWSAVLEPATYLVHVFEARCRYNLDGSPVTVPNGPTDTRPDCTVTPARWTDELEVQIDEPRPGELYGWPGLVEGQGPCVSAIDQAGNEGPEGCAPWGPPLLISEVGSPDQAGRDDDTGGP